MATAWVFNLYRGGTVLTWPRGTQCRRWNALDDLAREQRPGHGTAHEPRASHAANHIQRPV